MMVNSHHDPGSKFQTTNSFDGSLIATDPRGAQVWKATGVQAKTMSQVRANSRAQRHGWVRGDGCRVAATAGPPVSPAAVDLYLSYLE